MTNIQLANNSISDIHGGITLVRGIDDGLG